MATRKSGHSQSLNGKIFKKELLETWNVNSFPTFHRRFVGADTCAGIVGSQGSVYRRVAAFYHGGDELLHQVRMRTAVACTLQERYVVGVVDYFPLGKVLNGFNQHFVGIGYINALGILAAGEDHMAFILQLFPFELHLSAIYIVTLAVLPDHVEERAGSLGHHVGIFQSESSCFDGER